jgi:hypothetical protein
MDSFDGCADPMIYNPQRRSQPNKLPTKVCRNSDNYPGFSLNVQCSPLKHGPFKQDMKRGGAYYNLHNIS